MDEVPDGQQPTRITPTASGPSRRKIQHSSTATNGMITKWATVPTTTISGWVRIRLKSSSVSVRPMPNSTMPRKYPV